MHILISFCNGRIEGLPYLGLLDCDTGHVQALRLPTNLANAVGATGLAVSDEHLYVVIQDQEYHLAVFDRATLDLQNLIALSPMLDVHSLWLDGETLYAVSTGTDEIYRMRLRGTGVEAVEVYWRPDADGAREDRHHLNAIFGMHGHLYASGFGPKAGPRWGSARDGFIIDLSEKQSIASGIEHPHSVALIGDTLAYCESRHSALRFLGSERGQQLPGYTRGLCAIGDSIYVGTSLGRRVSKSTRLVNNPADPGVSSGGCAIYRLSAQSLAIEQAIDLSTFGYEIYELLPVEGAASWPTIPPSEWQPNLLRRLLINIDQQQAGGIPTIATYASTGEQRAAINALEHELVQSRQAFARRSAAANAENAALREELAASDALLKAMRSTRLWRWGDRFWRLRDIVRRRVHRNADATRSTE